MIFLLRLTLNLLVKYNHRTAHHKQLYLKTCPTVQHKLFEKKIKLSINNKKIKLRLAGKPRITLCATSYLNDIGGEAKFCP